MGPPRDPRRKTRPWFVLRVRDNCCGWSVRATCGRWLLCAVTHRSNLYFSGKCDSIRSLRNSFDREVAMTRALLALFVAILGIGTAAADEPLSTHDALIARAKSLELDTPYVPPPGDPLEHHTAGFAKVMCSAVFITGLDPEFAAENLGYFTSPYAERAKVGKPVIDRANQAVHITLRYGVTRTAKNL